MRTILLCFVLLASAGAPLHAVQAKPDSIDLAELCFTLATIQEPEVDVAAMRAALVQLEKDAKAKLVGAKDAADRVARLNQCLLTGRKVSYLSNQYWRDSTLAASLLRHRGNCISTATLYVVIAQRLSLPIRAVLVPHHAFARWDDGTTRINIETTDGGKEVPDSHYRQQWQWLDEDAKLLGLGQSLDDARFAAELRQLASRHLAQSAKPGPALAQLDQAIALWPGNDALRLARLSLLYTMGKREEALAGEAALMRSSPSPEVRGAAMLSLASDLQDHQKHAEALQLLFLAHKTAPKYQSSRVLSQMSTSYRALRRFGEALACQELSTALDGEADDWANLAIFYKNADRLEDAIRCLQVALAKNPESWSTRLMLAGYLIRAKREDDGWAMFKTVEKPRLDEEFYYTNLAWFYGSVGKQAEFLENLEQALSRSTTAGILDYISTEVDFDRYREAVEFKALVEKYRAKLGAGR
jgi:tetratricopeptide (TPR) repeat protein